ncbi:MAG: hypothetical protein HYY43_05045 [Deltaproteobacteria bacterium]|nr:hypothetical protein [Deltaproteobacteria bacterium]
MNPTLAFLWHMHQPYYRDMASGSSAQPWVRLHGIHSYYDMLKLYADAGSVCANINFVPSLLKQICEYVELGASDSFLDISRVDAKELTPAQKMFILKNFFMANPDKMIAPHPRYLKLFQHRGSNLNGIDIENTIRYFSWKDYLDIQVYYNLVWFGFKAREEFPEISRMLSIHSSGHIFTEEDKKAVLDIQSEVLKRLLSLIKNSPGNVELTTTPFFHAILPLLINTDTAKRCMPGALLPPKFSGPKHALFQLQHGLDFFEKTTGKKARGLWPAEGSVSPEIIPLLSESDVEWFATDEGILELSGVGGKKADYLYQPYIVEHEGKSAKAIFRDRELSDLISFSYAKMPADTAVKDLISRVENIAKQTSIKNPLITIILDGENPWESYEDNGRRFLTGLMEHLKKSGIRTSTISRYIAENPPTKKLNTMYSGSWINSNYAIWIGKPQKNKAWSYIKRTFDELGSKFSDIIDNKTRNEKELLALESFGAACGSDWFWWFDDDFESECKSDFDKIFRMHLKNAFALMGRDVPVFLFEPIFKYEEDVQQHNALLAPAAFINPNIDGINSSFFEWANSVKIDVGKGRGPMGQSHELIESIFFGFNPESFFLRFNPLSKNITFSLSEGEEIVIYLHDADKKYKLKLFFEHGRYQMQFVNSPEEGYHNGTHNIKWALRAVFEMGLNFADLGYKPGEEITVVITIVRHNLEVRHYSHLVFKIPDEKYEREMWSV